MMEQKLCKKCHRILPEGYKYKCCESCRNKQAKKFKDIVGALSYVAMIGVTFITKGKINLNKD